MEQARQWIESLQLKRHREGGYFKELPASTVKIQTKTGTRHAATNIYFLLTDQESSHFHRLQSEETWYYHTGERLTIHMIHTNGEYEQVHLGTNIAAGEMLQYTVPAQTIFGSTVERGFALVSCMVCPGFSYDEFELFTQKELCAQFPQHRSIIERLAYEQL